MPIPKRKPVKKTNETDADEREEDIMNTDETKNESYVEENHEEVTESKDAVETTDNDISATESEDTPEETEYPVMVDGTDIRKFSHTYRKHLSVLAKADIDNWYHAKHLREWHEDTVQFKGKTVSIITGDYIFPYSKSQYYLGYILDVTERIYNGVKNLYFYVAIGNEVKTVKCVLGAFNDVISKSIKRKFGAMFTVDQLIYRPVKIKVDNKTDDEGYIIFSEIVEFKFLSDGYVNEFLFCSYKHLNDKII